MSEEEKYEQLRQVCVSYRNEVADLEAKLAEKEHSIGMLNQHLTDKAIEIERLGEELAEKEKEIAELKQKLKNTIKIYSDDFVSKDTELKELRYKVKQHDQDKISFAVEQLEKVKKYADIDYRNHCYIDAVKLDKFINNQIEELKKEMK